MLADPLPRTFYQRDPITVARDLLGKTLHRRSRQGLTSGTIVEVEAYLAKGDSACHAFRGPTPRNRTMFGPPGHLYVYSIHARYCLNAVTEQAGIASAVLIRAIEPLAGLAVMRARRGRAKPIDYARGPARLCEACDVTRRLDGWDLTRGRRIWIAAGNLDSEAAGTGDSGFGHSGSGNSLACLGFRTGQSPRIGVTSAQHAPLRFFVDGSPYVSGPRRDHSPR